MVSLQWPITNAALATAMMMITVAVAVVAIQHVVSDLLDIQKEAFHA